MKRIIGITLAIKGSILLLNSFSGITGFSVFSGIGKQVGSTLGIMLLVGGVLLLATAKKERAMGRLEEKLSKEKTVKGKVRLIENAYQRHLLNDEEAADEINKIVHLGGMIYKTQVQFTVQSDAPIPERYSLSIKDDPDLAYAMRDRIIENNPAYKRNCQLHIAKGESTKDYKKGLRRA